MLPGEKRLKGKLCYAVLCFDEWSPRRWAGICFSKRKTINLRDASHLFFTISSTYRKCSLERRTRGAQGVLRNKGHTLGAVKRFGTPAPPTSPVRGAPVQSWDLLMDGSSSDRQGNLNLCNATGPREATYTALAPLAISPPAAYCTWKH